MEETIVVGSILAVIAFFGVVFNGTVVVANRKSAAKKHSFGILTANQAMGDAIHSSLFLLYVVPMIVLNQKTMAEYSHYAGYILLVCYDLSTQSHFLISCNRFCAVYFPMSYSTVFSESRTHWMTYIVNITSVTLTFCDAYIGCPLFWAPDLWLFIFPSTLFCNFLVFYTDFCKYVSTVTLIVILDVVTVFRVQQMARRVEASTLADPRSMAKRSREMSFLKQTCFQGAVFTTELITYFILSPHIEHQWIRFFCTSVAWVSVHSIDGFLSIYFNADFRKFAKKHLLRIRSADSDGSTTFTTKTSHA